MKFLIDTNVLLRMGDFSHPMSKAACGAVESLQKRGHSCFLIPQILYEYWVVSTRPLKNNGLGLSAAATNTAITAWLAEFQLQPEAQDLFERWWHLVVTYDICGKNAHDARIASAMQCCHIDHILTFNTQDFVRFPFLHAWSPNDILAGKLGA